MATFMPIMQLDVQRLSPSLGYIFDRRRIDSYESLVTILRKFGHMNGLAGHVVAAHVSREPVDTFDDIEAHRDVIDTGRLRVVLGVSRKVLHESVIAARRRGAVRDSFRYLGQCLSRGYHSLVNQFERGSQCPIHARSLGSACRCCGYWAANRLHARVLETPYRCAQCRSLYGTQCPRLTQRGGMPIKDLIPLTRLWIKRCLFRGGGGGWVWIIVKTDDLERISMIAAQKQQHGWCNSLM